MSAAHTSVRTEGAGLLHALAAGPVDETEPKSFGLDMQRHLEAARAPLSACMSTLRIWRIAAQAGDALIEAGAVMANLQCALIVANKILDEHTNSLGEAPGQDFLIGHSLAHALEDALWNCMNDDEIETIAVDDAVAVAGLALQHLQLVADWLERQSFGASSASKH